MDTSKQNSDSSQANLKLEFSNKSGQTRTKLDFVSEVAFGMFLVFIMGLFSIPISLFYAWRDPQVNSWSNESFFSQVLSHAENCHNQVISPVKSNKTQCTYQYVDVCGVCIPKCTSWHTDLFSDTDRTSEEDILITACVASLFGALVFIAMALKRRDEMFAFPSVLRLYEIALEMILAITVLIPLAWDESLYCSHEDAIQTMHATPTPYCIFSGLVFQFTTVCIALLWVIHVGYITLLIKFPFFGMKLKEKAKLIHLASISITLLLSSVGPILTGSTVGYFPARFPVLACVPRNIDALFYSISCPVLILTAIGTLFWLLLFRALRKNFHTNYQKERLSLSDKPQSTVSQVEKKVLFLGLSTPTICIIIISRFSQNFANQFESTHDLAQYPYCQLQIGNVNTTNCTLNQDASNGVRPILDGAVYFVFALIVFVNWALPLKQSDFITAKNCLLTLTAGKVAPSREQNRGDFV